MALIKCKNISVSYDGKKVIDNLSFGVDKGQALCIVGENGSGKTTLVKAILSLIKLSGGEIKFGDGLLQNEIGYLPQQTELQKDFPASVSEIILSGCINKMGLRPFYTKRERALADKKTYSTWSEGLEQIFEAVLENKPFILNVYHSVSQKKIESYLYKLTYDLLADVVEEECRDAAVSGEDKALIAEFYKYGFVGMMLHWIDGGMKADYRELVQRLSTMLRGSILNAARNFEQKQSASLAKEPE